MHFQHPARVQDGAASGALAMEISRAAGRHCRPAGTSQLINTSSSSSGPGRSRNTRFRGLSPFLPPGCAEISAHHACLPLIRPTQPGPEYQRFGYYWGKWAMLGRAEEPELMATLCKIQPVTIGLCSMYVLELELH